MAGVEAEPEFWWRVVPTAVSLRFGGYAECDWWKDVARPHMVSIVEYVLETTGVALNRVALSDLHKHQSSTGSSMHMAPDWSAFRLTVADFDDIGTCGFFSASGGFQRD